MDIDRFDTVNQRDGYLEGDKILQKIASSVMQTLRGDDVAGHIGEDKFAIILRDSPAVDTQMVIDRVKHIIAESFGEKYTLSTGIAVYPACGESSGKLLFNAVEALKEAKLRGQNRIQISEPRLPRKLEEESTIKHFQ